VQSQRLFWLGNRMDVLNADGRLLFRIPEGWEPTLGQRDLLVGADLRGAQLIGADLGGANLHGVCLFGADLYQAHLAGADLSGADLEGASLRGADLEDADLSLANLANADLSASNIALFTRLGGAKLLGANLTNTNLNGSLYDATTVFPEGFVPGDHGMFSAEECQNLLIRQGGTL
jgi:uncharacterized protein YjbI with pentapeptide repeats